MKIKGKRFYYVNQIQNRRMKNCIHLMSFKIRRLNFVHTVLYALESRTYNVENYSFLFCIIILCLKQYGHLYATPPNTQSPEFFDYINRRLVEKKFVTITSTIKLLSQPLQVKGILVQNYLKIMVYTFVFFFS